MAALWPFPSPSILVDLFNKYYFLSAAPPFLGCRGPNSGQVSSTTNLARQLVLDRCPIQPCAHLRCNKSCFFALIIPPLCHPGKLLSCLPFRHLPRTFIFAHPDSGSRRNNIPIMFHSPPSATHCSHDLVLHVDNGRSEHSSSPSSTTSSFGQDGAWSMSPSKSTEDILRIIMKTRKSWKTIKGNSEAVWPPYLEAAMLKGAIQSLLLIIPLAHMIDPFRPSRIRTRRFTGNTNFRQIPYAQSLHLGVYFPHDRQI